MKGMTYKRLAMGLVVATGCAGLAQTLRPMLLSTPDAKKAPHALHKKSDVDCLQCHETIYDATELTGSFTAKEETCLQCHQADKDKGECQKCHSDPQRPTTYAPLDGHLKMSHAKHIELVKEDCTVCHKALPEPSREPATVPPMSVCLSCHEHQEQYEQGRCDVCHQDLARYPLEPVSDFRHSPGWLRDHRDHARAAAASCASCHEQTFCADCHAKTQPLPPEIEMPERVDREFIHQGDFLSRHSLEARANPALCLTCHGKSGCESCHESQGLTPEAKDPRNPHPPSWRVVGTGSRLHAQAARQDIASCAACHDQGAASICVECHRVGGIGGNPHPRGWRSRHDEREITENGMCLTCHR